MSNSTSRVRKDDGNLGISVANFVWIYVAPIILLVGVVGNTLTIAVMRRKRLRAGTVAIYLVLIAIADTCFLIVGIIPEWLEAMGIIIFKKIHPATCKVEKFFGYSAGDISIWLLVVFTFDRFVAVCFPLKKSQVCTTWRAWILVGFCVLLAIAKNLHVFWTRGAEYIMEGGVEMLKSNCGRPTPEYRYFENYVRPWIAFTLVSVLPCCFISTFNIGIVRTLLKVPRAHQTADCSSTKMERKFSQATLMCVSVSVLFLVTITPSIVLLIGRPYWDSDAKNPNYAYLTAKGLNNALVFMNHSLNFFLYCLTGKRFREQFLLMFRTTCCGIYPDGLTARSTAHTASLYIKSIHKLSREIISSAARTDETTAGTSVSNGLTTTGQASQSAKPAARMKRDKSKQSVKSLDSESSFSYDMTVIPLRELPPVSYTVVALGPRTDWEKASAKRPPKSKSKLAMGNPSRSCQNDNQGWIEQESPQGEEKATHSSPHPGGPLSRVETGPDTLVIRSNSDPGGSSNNKLPQPELQKASRRDPTTLGCPTAGHQDMMVEESDIYPPTEPIQNEYPLKEEQPRQGMRPTDTFDVSTGLTKDSGVFGKVNFPGESVNKPNADQVRLEAAPDGGVRTGRGNPSNEHTTLPTALDMQPHNDNVCEQTIYSVHAEDGPLRPPCSKTILVSKESVL